jgi:hypothetical protein
MDVSLAYPQPLKDTWKPLKFAVDHHERFDDRASKETQESLKLLQVTDNTVLISKLKPRNKSLSFYHKFLIEEILNGIRISILWGGNYSIVSLLTERK